MYNETILAKVKPVQHIYIPNTAFFMLLTYPQVSRGSLSVARSECEQDESAGGLVVSVPRDLWQC